MPHTRVTVLGGSGMLGAMVADVLSRNDRLRVRATVRSEDAADRLSRRMPGVEVMLLDAERCSLEALNRALAEARFLINAIGVIKSHIRDDRQPEVERALRVNALFPHLLARAAAASGTHVLQIATDCVWSGARGRYDETDAHDALDVYGKTKSLGEARGADMHHLRCSIVGPEPARHVSLLDWFRRQPRHAHVRGFVNHLWNGVTTYHFARLCEAVATSGLPLPHLQHVVPAGTISKADLLDCFRQAFSRADVTIEPVQTPVSVDRTLATIDEAANRALWRAAGYHEPPSVPRMVEELAAYEFRAGDLLGPSD